MDAIQIRSGSFYAELYPDQLGALPRSNYRKLLRLMRRAQWENQAALDSLGVYLRDQVRDRWAAQEIASLNCANGWKYVANKRSREKADLDILRENRRLKAALKRAKGAYDTAVALQTIYEKEIN